MDVEISLLKELKPTESILICGLPGIAYIGKLSADYLIRELKAELVGEIHSKFFPPYVLIRKDGVVELLRNELYYLNNTQGRDIFFFTGNAQASSPEGQYTIANMVLDQTKRLGVKSVYSIAAYLTHRPSPQPRVYGTATTPALMKTLTNHGIHPMKQGIISGINGLIFGLAQKKQLDGFCLLGETRGYQTPNGQFLLDAKAVRAVLEVLTKMLDLTVDMEPLDKQTEQMDELIKRMEAIERKVREETHGGAARSQPYIT